jgi:hypothetical protein
VIIKIKRPRWTPAPPVVLKVSPATDTGKAVLRQKVEELFHISRLGLIREYDTPLEILILKGTDA